MHEFHSSQGLCAVSNQLFRQEVIERQGERFWADFSLLKPVRMAVMSLLMFSLVIAIAWILIGGEYRRKVVVTGVIVSDKGAVKIRAPASGVVEEVVFGQGEWVGRGDLLLKISSDKASLNGGEIAASLIMENSQQIDILHKLIQEKKSIFPLRLEPLNYELTGLEITKRQLLASLENQKKVSDLMRSKVDRFKDLLSNLHVSMSDIDSVRMEALQQESALHQSRIELQNNTRSIEKVQYEKQLRKMEFAQQLAELEKQLSELRKQNIRLQAEQHREVLAPVSGLISIVYPRQGQAIIEQQPLLVMLQEDALFEAELYVPSRAIGFLEKGLEVELGFDAFPYQKFGIVKAVITEVSRSVLLPEDIQDSQGMNEPYYRVTAELDEAFISAYGNKVNLRAGMQLKANIVLESRNLIEWVLEPFFVRGGLR